MVDFNDINNIREFGFTGFRKIRDLNLDPSIIPDKRGIYFVLIDNPKAPAFIIPGNGGHFKGKNPNVSIEELKNNWVINSRVVYIGKAGGSDSSATLRSRLKQYLKFGQGKPVGHWGGRYIWQIQDSESLIICWKHIPVEEPRTAESLLIAQFVSSYGKRPFANLTG